MQKALTVEALNQLFSKNKQEIFEYPGEKADWKYPKYVKVDKNRRYVQQKIDDYNEINVTK